MREKVDFKKVLKAQELVRGKKSPVSEEELKFVAKYLNPIIQYSDKLREKEGENASFGFDARIIGLLLLRWKPDIVRHLLGLINRDLLFRDEQVRNDKLAGELYDRLEAEEK